MQILRYATQIEWRGCATSFFTHFAWEHKQKNMLIKLVVRSNWWYGLRWNVAQLTDKEKFSVALEETVPGRSSSNFQHQK